MSSPQFITIKLEIQVPTCGGVPVVSTTVPTPVTVPVPAPRRLERLSTLRCPNASSGPIPVRPSGSGASTGSIFSWAQFSNTPPTEVRIQVVSPIQIAAVRLQTEPVLGDTTAGTPSMGGLLWTWGADKPVGNVAHSSSGMQNFLVIWTTTDSGATWHQEDHSFSGVTGSDDPGGDAMGGPCGPGPMSGSGPSGSVPDGSAPSVLPVAAAVARTYPAVWLVVAGGFATPPLVMFNATWALRQVTGAKRLTWDNAGDGRQAPGIRLELCPKDGWMLALRFGDVRVSYTHPFRGETFGPLQFASRHEVVSGLGTVALPSIQISAL